MTRNARSQLSTKSSQSRLALLGALPEGPPVKLDVCTDRLDLINDPSYLGVRQRRLRGEPYKQAYAQSRDAIAEWRVSDQIPSLLEVIENASATALLGLSGISGAFNQPVVNAMCQNTTRPLIFPLSNPTSISEALPVELIQWSEGRAIVATGSPFPDVDHGGQRFPVGQGNNAFIFPGLGFGAILSESRTITDCMVLDSAYALAEYTAANHLEGVLDRRLEKRWRVLFA